MNKGIVLLGHGSRRQAANVGLDVLSGMVQVGLGIRVLPAYFQFASPSLSDVVDRLAGEGVKEIIIVPAFLFPGMHLEKDVPQAIKELKAKYNGELQLTVTPSLGADPRLAEILVERVRSVLAQGALGNDGESSGAGCEILNPAEITARSRVLIEEALGTDFFPNHFPGPEGEVVRRVVHAMGNPDVAYLMRFHPGAVQAGIEALTRGCTIFTDVRMVQNGISAPGLARFGGRTVCMIHDPAVQTLAKEQGLTRALVAVRQFKEQLPGNIVAIGNAPTALSETLKQAVQGFRPDLIVGTPVGFVGAAESKAHLAASDIPYITLAGNQGGSTAAAAVINALLALAQGRAGL
jgi:precorrin-8X/cobalt-precorrin-8 methylmutase